MDDDDWMLIEDDRSHNLSDDPSKNFEYFSIKSDIFVIKNINNYEIHINTRSLIYLNNDITRAYWYIEYLILNCFRCQHNIFFKVI